MLLMDLEKDKTNLKEPLWDLMAWKLRNFEAQGIKYLDFGTGKAHPLGSEYTEWLHFQRGLAQGNDRKRTRVASHAFQLSAKILLASLSWLFFSKPRTNPNRSRFLPRLPTLRLELPMTPHMSASPPVRPLSFLPDQHNLLCF